MRVLLGFGDAQLSLVVLRHPLAEGIGQGRRRVCAGDFDVGGIFGQHHEVEFDLFLTGKTVEIGVDEGTGDFTGAVSTEVHENQRIAVFHRGIGLACGTDHGRLHELIIFIASVSGLQTGNGGIGLELALRQGHQIICLLNAVPVIVAVHGVVAANNGSHAAFTESGKFFFKFRQ